MRGFLATAAAAVALAACPARGSTLLPADTHPGPARRLAVLGSAPRVSDGRPALELLRNADGVVDQATELLFAREVVKARPLDWDHCFHAAGRIANSRVAMALSVKVGGAGDLSQVLGLWERGGLPEFGVRAVMLSALASAGHVHGVLVNHVPVFG